MLFLTLFAKKCRFFLFRAEKCAGVHKCWTFETLSWYNRSIMAETTIVTSSPLGQHLDKIAESQQVSYLVFNKKKIELVAKIAIGRESDNDIVIDSKLASRHHCIIQKIRDAYFLKDENSTNGTYVNGRRIPSDKYVRLNVGDKVTVGSSNIVMA